MDRHFLSALFDPKSVLLLHAGQARADVAAVLAERLAARTGPLHRLDLDGHAPSGSGGDTSPAVAPGADALALLALPDERVEQAIAVAATHGARAAIVFAEGDGAAWRERWLAAARRAGVRLVGPGALGVQRPHARLDASLLATTVFAGGIALVSQSGAIASSMLDWARDAGVGFSAVIALGDEIDVTVSDVLDFLSSDTRTHSVVLYLEGVHEARRFVSALRATTAAKPVAVLKAGGEAGLRAADGGPWPRLAPYSRGAFADAAASGAGAGSRTHAGAMFGSRDVYEAALRRAGAVQIRYFLQLFDTVEYLASRHRPFGRRLAIVSNGTGPALLAADLAREFHVRLPGFGAHGANPQVLRADVGPQAYADALVAAAEHEQVDGVMAVFAPHALVDAEALTQRVVDAARRLSKPLFACWLGDFTTRPLRRLLSAVPVPTMRTPEAAMAAYATVASYFHNQQLSQQAPRSLGIVDPPDVEAARALIDAALSQGRTTLTEPESKSLLEAFRLPVTRIVVARDAEHAAEVAQSIGFPVAMKVVSPDIAHKHAVGGVALNVASAADAHAQHARLLRNARQAAPGARIEGVGIEPMRGGSATREIYVGAWRDPVFGPVLAFGAGGTQVEFSHDVTVELPPLNEFLARRMIERTRIADALESCDAVQAALLRVSEMVCELPSIAEMDINPVRVDADGAVAVDARFVLAPVPAGATRHAHLAIMPYPAELRRKVQLSDGSMCTVRPIDPLDADDLQDFMRSLSPQTRYFRFVSTVAEHSPRQLARFTQIDYDREMALVAVQPADDEPVASPNGAGPAAGERIIGAVRYMLNPDLHSGEFAIVVGDDQQGKGLGRRLMHAIIDAARGKGLESLEGYVVAGNTRMLGLMRALGFSDRADPEDPSMRIVVLRL